ncbi:alpha/beta fold hydrolase [Marinobacterium sp. YM272]|uniref:alpha/beta fold hydrolase n=1 Tax=Marinobacterium sp. YM272 TaxID=3421654 RepID=UPI003D7F723D
MPIHAHHLILIHGAWATPGIWSRVTPLFEAEGFCVHPVSLPGDGTDDQPDQPLNLEATVQRLTRLIHSLEGPVSLVAHSGGGVIATALAEAMAERIRGVVYIAGMMLPSGMGFAELVQSLSVKQDLAGISPHLQWNADRSASRVPPEAAIEIFFQDMPRDEAANAAASLVEQPESTRSMTTRWSNACFGQIPRLYVEASEDRSVLPVLQKEMQRLVPGARRVTLNSGHAPQLSQPHQLIQEIASFLCGTAKPLSAPSRPVASTP